MMSFQVEAWGVGSIILIIIRYVAWEQALGDDVLPMLPDLAVNGLYWWNGEGTRSGVC
jgi:hypothetical protein